ncbi:MAG: hypothetical protein U1E81_12135 [Xanthobacteraceae bacterium]
MSGPKFEIGLVMAGAISAGAYSAGVVDFIIEALDKITRPRNALSGTALGTTSVFPSSLARRLAA